MIRISTSGTPVVVCLGALLVRNIHISLQMLLACNCYGCLNDIIVWPLLTSIYKEMLTGHRLVLSAKCQKELSPIWIKGEVYLCVRK